MIEFEREIEPSHSASATDLAGVQVNALHFGFDKPDMAKNAAERVNDITWIKVARRYLMQHGGEQDEIFAADQYHFRLGPTSECLVEVHCGAEPGKSTTRYDDSGFHL